MPSGARVRSIDALKEVKRALDAFAAVAATALGEAHADVRRTVSWLQHDQLAYWRNQKRRREMKLAHARSELFRAQTASRDARVPATEQRRAVERAQHLCEEADLKLRNIRLWGRRLEREALLYKAGCQALARALDGDLPRAKVRLDRMIAALEKYVALAAPRAPRAAAQDEDGDDAKAREEEERR